MIKKNRLNITSAFIDTKKHIIQSYANNIAARPSDEELQLGALCLGLCSLSYSNEELLADPELDNNHRELLHIVKKEDLLRYPSLGAHKITEPYRIWTDTAVNATTGEEYIESQMITGFIQNQGNNGYDKNILIPFICFRGSISITDFYRDVQAMKTTLLYTSKGKVVGECGSGFFEMHSELLKPQYHAPIPMNEGDHIQGVHHAHRSSSGLIQDDPLPPVNTPYPVNDRVPVGIIRLMDTIKTNMKATNYAGLIICGHRLGGAVSTLFYAELLHDYPEIVEKLGDRLKVVTFGSPRAVDLRLADVLDHSPAVHLRFVNDNDIITALPTANMQLFYHWGKCLFAPEYFEEEEETGKIIHPGNDSWSNTLALWKERLNWCLGVPPVAEPAHCWLIVHDPKKTISTGRPPVVGDLDCRDFGVDRLHETRAVLYELRECIRDQFAAHKVTNWKGYAGQFTGETTPKAARELIQKLMQINTDYYSKI